MNLLGKIFIMLILIMSVLFMGMALMVYATHKNWKEEITRATAAPGQPLGWKARYEALQAENEQLTTQRDELAKTVTAVKAERNEAIAKMETAIQALNQTLTAQQQELTNKSEALAQSTATLKTQQDNLTKATAAVQALTENIKGEQTRADNWFKAALQLNDQLSQAMVQIPNLEERLKGLSDMVGKARLLLAQNGMTIDEPIDQRPPPITTTVSAINSEGLVEIGVGTHDGIRLNHELDVVREGRFLGRIRIVDVEKDRAVGQIVRDYYVSQIRAGDTVTSKLRTLARQGSRPKEPVR
jgi:hypothetical protein